MQPDQKLYLLYDGRRNKYQSGEVFEAAFYYERVKLELITGDIAYNSSYNL